MLPGIGAKGYTPRRSPIPEKAALAQATPEIFNTDQGSQFTSAAFTGTLAAHGVRISMDGRGRFTDNIFVERLWRSVKYEEVSLHAYESVAEAKAGIGRYLRFTTTSAFIKPLASGRHARCSMPTADLWICGQRWRVAHNSTGPTTTAIR